MDHLIFFFFNQTHLPRFTALDNGTSYSNGDAIIYDNERNAFFIN